MSTHFDPHQFGVTLLECCITCAVAAVAMSVAAPSFSEHVSKQRLILSAKQFAHDLSFARTEALRRQSTIAISFDTSSAGSCYIIHTDTQGPCTCPSAGQVQCPDDAAIIKSAFFESGNDLRLSANVNVMRLDPYHATVTPTSSVTFAHGNRFAIVERVNVLGRVRTCAAIGHIAGHQPC